MVTTDRYPVRRLRDPADLAHWPDAPASQVFR